MQPRQHNIRRLFSLLFSVVFLLFAVWVFFNRQSVIDHFIVYKYPPSASLMASADRAGLNDQGKFLLYASLPRIEDKQTFSKSCDNAGEKTAVLGCYSAQRIYVLDVQDPKLDGIEEVTLAHEMLHAAYDRLSGSEKNRVNALIEAQYRTNTDQHLADLVKIYDREEPGERDNELHSLLATEIQNLNPELEDYYKSYFADRQKAVNLFEKYDNVFEEIKNKQQALVDELNKLAAQINADITTYNKNAEQLAADIETFNKNADSYTSATAFNRDRNALQSRQNNLRASRETISAERDSYDVKKKELDAIMIQAAQLNQSINSNIQATPTL